MFRPDSYYSSVRIKDNLYFYIWQGMGNNCNTCLITNVLKGNRPHVIVDPGSRVNEAKEACFDHLVAAIEKNGLKGEDVGMIINTHSHSDHCSANQALAVFPGYAGDIRISSSPVHGRRTCHGLAGWSRGYYDGEVSKGGMVG